MVCHQVNAGVHGTGAMPLLHMLRAGAMAAHRWLTGPAGLAANDTWKKHLIHHRVTRTAFFTRWFEPKQSSPCPTSFTFGSSAAQIFALLHPSAPRETPPPERKVPCLPARRSSFVSLKNSPTVVARGIFIYSFAGRPILMHYWFCPARSLTARTHGSVWLRTAHVCSGCLWQVSQPILTVSVFPFFCVKYVRKRRHLVYSLHKLPPALGLKKKYCQDSAPKSKNQLMSAGFAPTIIADIDEQHVAALRNASDTWPRTS
jgi:hypothetical protein